MPNVVDIDCELKDETDKAYLVVIDGDTEHWVPKSLSEWEEKKHGSVDCTLTVAEWFATKEGMI